jgi:hypothetical protein
LNVEMTCDELKKIVVEKNCWLFNIK